MQAKRRRCDPSKEICDFRSHEPEHFSSEKDNPKSEDGKGEIPIPPTPTPIDPEIDIPLYSTVKTHEYKVDDQGRVLKDGEPVSLDSTPRSVRSELAAEVRAAGQSQVTGDAVDLTPHTTVRAYGVETEVPKTVHDTTKLTTTATKVGKVSGGALAVLDIGNTIYENRDDLSQVVTVIENIPSQVVDDAAAVYEAVKEADLVTLGDVAYSYTPIPVVTRTVDNLAGMAGVSLNTTEIVQDVVHDVGGLINAGAHAAWNATFGRWF